MESTARLIHQAADALAASRRVVALTGAGISIESGIPPFRGKGGLWEKVDPMEYAHIDTFMHNPLKVWQVLLKGLKQVVDQACPNDAHHGLFRLEKLGKLKTVITQNVDGLHQMAGNTDVIEFHGSFARHRCLSCGTRLDSRSISMDRLPPYCDCGGLLRPELVFFGELIPPLELDRSQQVAAQCDLMLVIGTSAVVQPAAYMPVIARQAGAKVIEINPEPTPLTGGTSHFLIQGRATDIVKRLVDQLETLMGE